MQDSLLGLKMVASSLARHIHRIQWMVGTMGGAQERAYEDSDNCLFAPDGGNLRITSISHIKDGILAELRNELFSWVTGAKVHGLGSGSRVWGIIVS